MLQAFAADEFTATTDSSARAQSSVPSIISRGLLAGGAEGTVSFHGPTSIIRSNPEFEILDSANSSRRPDLDSSQTTSNFEHVAGHFGIDLKSAIITAGLQNFFKWQYPHFMFIYREAFLRDHFSTRQNCRYWSPALLMSICAMGLLMSDDDGGKEMSIRCFHAAESITLVAGSSGSSLVLVQALLCLAFYEIGRGNLSKGWALSGTEIGPFRQG